MNAFNHKDYAAEGFKDFSEYSDGIEYVNQSEYGDDCLEGEWYYGDDEALVIYSGSFGNYNSPGADSYTNAERFETAEEYREELAKWEACPEYLPREANNEDEETNEDE